MALDVRSPRRLMPEFRIGAQNSVCNRAI